MAELATNDSTYTRGVRAILLNRVLLILAFLGLYVAGILSLGHLLEVDIPCGGSNDCAVVANHPASKLFGTLPVAYLGFLAYVGLAIVAVLRTANGMRNSQRLVMIGFALAAVGTVFSLYLQYQSFAVIHATCKWCMASAAIMVLTLIGHAVLAQASESEEVGEGRPSKLDSVLMMALPLVLVLGLAVQGSSLSKADSGVAGGGKKLGRETFDKLVAGQVNSIGAKDGKVTIIEFADLQCGACQTHSPTVKALVEQFPTKMRLIYRHFPLAQRHQWAMPSAAVSEYAAEKGKFWDFALAVMDLKRELESSDELYSIAQQVGLNVEDLKKRMTNPDDPAYKKVVSDMDLAGELGVEVTPTFFIATEGGNTIEIATSRDVLEILQSEKYKKIING